MDAHPMFEGSPTANEEHEVAHLYAPPSRHSSAEPISYPGLAGARDTQTTPTKLPHELTIQLGRIKKIIKQDGDVKAVSTDANYIIAKAAEMLLDKLVETSAQHALAREKTQLLAYNDVAASVEDAERLNFLRDVIPRKVQADVLLEEWEQWQDRGKSQYHRMDNRHGVVASVTDDV